MPLSFPDYIVLVTLLVLALSHALLLVVLLRQSSLLVRLSFARTLERISGDENPGLKVEAMKALGRLSIPPVPSRGDDGGGIPIGSPPPPSPAEDELGGVIFRTRM